MPNDAGRPITDLPRLALKLREAMAKKDVSNADVAREFGVTPATVSKDWRQFGRIDKKHYPRLIGFFGLPYEWWFGEPIGGEAPDLYAIRRDNLRLAIDEKWEGSIATAAGALGLAVDELHHYLDPRTRKHPIVPLLARKIERVGKLGKLWMDIPHDVAQPSRQRRKA